MRHHLIAWLGRIILRSLAAFHTLQNARLASRMQSCGQQVAFDGECYISQPGTVAIGHNVSIGDGAHFVTQGGLTIGNNARLDRNVTINTIDAESFPFRHGSAPAMALRPVVIGSDVWIQANACIGPGAWIEDGAVVKMGSTVTGRSTSARLPANAPSFDQGSRLFFVVTTGRSGSTTIAHALSQHPQIRCHHELRPQLIRLSTELAHQAKSREETKAELYAIYRNSSVFPTGLWHGEADQKLFNLVDILADLLPGSVFVWLIRDGRDTVASMVARGWYSAEQMKQAHPFRQPWDYYRLDGYLAGSVQHGEWVSMSPFEKCCWAWQYINTSIEQQIRMLPPERQYFLRLEDVESQMPSLLEALGCQAQPIHVPVLNAGRRAPARWQAWDGATHQAFERWCNAGMDRWYPGWGM